MTRQTTHGEPSSSGSSTSRSLLERLNEQEAAAWSELVHLYSPLILFWCQRQGLTTHVSEDILQEVLRTVVANITRFRKEKPSDTFRGWLRTITRSRIADHFRRNLGEPGAVGGTDAHLRLSQLAQSFDNPDRDAEDGDDETEAHRALYLRAIELIRRRFEEQTWRAFWRVVVDGCTAQEVAQELGMRAGTVRVAKSRVLKRLREQLGDVLD